MGIFVKLLLAFWYPEATLLTILAGQLLIMLSVGSLLGDRLVLGRQWLALYARREEILLTAICY